MFLDALPVFSAEEQCFPKAGETYSRLRLRLMELFLSRNIYGLRPNRESACSQFGLKPYIFLLKNNSISLNLNLSKKLSKTFKFHSMKHIQA